MTIDWDEIGTLRQMAWDYDIRTDPLWILVMTAKQGHEGSLEDMRITMASGAVYRRDEIQALAVRPDRKWDA
ncbi:MAG: hypothetical protein ACAH11_11450 [Sphingomonas sp.]